MNLPCTRVSITSLADIKIKGFSIRWTLSFVLTVPDRWASLFIAPSKLFRDSSRKLTKFQKCRKVFCLGLLDTEIIRMKIRLFLPRLKIWLLVNQLLALSEMRLMPKEVVEMVLRPLWMDFMLLSRGSLGERTQQSTYFTFVMLLRMVANMVLKGMMIILMVALVA